MKRLVSEVFVVMAVSVLCSTCASLFFRSYDALAFGLVLGLSPAPGVLIYAFTTRSQYGTYVAHMGFAASYLLWVGLWLYVWTSLQFERAAPEAESLARVMLGFATVAHMGAYATILYRSPPAQGR